MGDLEIFWSVVGKIAVGLGIIVGLHQSYKYLRRESPTGKLEERMTKMEEMITLDRKRIERLEQKTDETQEQIKHINEGVQRIGRSQIALLRHTIDGNGIDKMREEADDLTDFFINR